MKLSDIGKPNPQTFEFIDPFTESPTGIFITVHALKSRIGKEAISQMQHSILRLRQDENNLIEIDGKQELKPELEAEEKIKCIADITDSWHGVEDDNGKQIKPSKEAFIKAFTQSSELMNAVLTFASNLANFTAQSVNDL